MFNIKSQKVLSTIEPRFDEINLLRNYGCQGYWDLERDRGNKVFNLMNTNPAFTNLAVTPSMNTDSDSNGVVDNFGSGNFGGVSATYTLDESAQRINLTSQTTTNYAWVQQNLNGFSPNEPVSVGFDAKVSGDVEVAIVVEYYNGPTWLSAVISPYTSPTQWTTISFLNQACPASTTKIDIRACVKPKAVGNSGIAWFKNAVVVKAITLTPSGTNGTVTGATQKPLGKYFDGVDDVVTVLDNQCFKVTDKFTLECFFNSAINQTSVPLCGYSYTAGSAFKYMLYLSGNSGGLNFYVNHPIAGNSFIAYSSLVNGYFNNKYWHFVGVFDKNASDGNRLKLYLNGILVSSGVGTNENINLTGDNKFYIGNNIFGNPFKGQIGITRLYNKALTQAQVTQIFKSNAIKYGISS